MTRFKCVVKYGGKWVGNEYTGGQSYGTIIPETESFEQFQSRMEQLAGSGPLQSVRILYSYQNLGVEVLEVKDENSYEFMKDDTLKDTKLFFVEIIDRNSLVFAPAGRPSNYGVGDDESGAPAGGNNANENHGGRCSFQNTSADVNDDIISSYQQADAHGSIGASSHQHDLPDPSSLFCNYDWSTDDCVGVGSNDIEPLLPSPGALGVSAIFSKKDDLVEAVGMYALQHRFEYKVNRSCTKRFSARCKHGACTFLVRAKCTCPPNGLWVVHEFRHSHTCEQNVEETQNRKVTARTIGRIYGSKVIGVKQTAKHVVQDMQHNYGVSINYSKAWRGLEQAKDIAYGTPEESYTLLPYYLHMVERSNPGTVTHLKILDGRFWMSFCAFGASIHGFNSFLRPVIVIDATHLTGVYKGKIYAAVAGDGNGQIFPLAISFGGEECNEIWEWFLRRLREAFGMRDDLIIVSDRHKSIRHAVSVVYPSVPHVFCYQHMKKNIQKYCRNSAVLSMFKRAMYTYKKEECERDLLEICRMHGKVFAWLVTGVRRENWARSYCEKSRWNHMTSNHIESFNQAMKDARKMPICAAHEFYLVMVQRWFKDRRQKAEALMGFITEYAQARIDKLADKIDQVGCHVTEIVNGDRFAVMHPEEGWATVSLSERSCDCRKWDLDGMPCLHALAAAR